MQKLTKFKVIFDLFTVCVYFIQQQNCKLYYIYLVLFDYWSFHNRSSKIIGQGTSIDNGL